MKLLDTFAPLAGFVLSALVLAVLFARWVRWKWRAMLGREFERGWMVKEACTERREAFDNAVALRRLILDNAKKFRRVMRKIERGEHVRLSPLEPMAGGPDEWANMPRLQLPLWQHSGATPFDEWAPSAPDGSVVPVEAPDPDAPAGYLIRRIGLPSVKPLPQGGTCTEISLVLRPGEALAELAEEMRAAA